MALSMAKVTYIMAHVTNTERDVKTDDKWINLAKGILRSEMTRRGITYDKLSEMLAEHGVKDGAVNIRNKVARGGISAALFLQCLLTIGCHILHLEDA